MRTTFPQLLDLDNIYTLLEERGDRLFPTVSYKILERATAEVDDVHDEVSEERKQFEDVAEVKAYMYPDRVTLPMRKFGLERMRGVVMSISIPHMIGAGLATQDPDTYEVTLVAGIGDRFWHSEAVEYDVLGVVRGKMFGITDIPLFFDFQAEIFREVSSQYADL